MPLRAPVCRHPKSEGAKSLPARGGVRTCQKRPRPGARPSHPPRPGLSARRRQVRPSSGRRAPEAPSASCRARIRLPGQPAEPARGPAPARALRQPRREASPTWRPRRASRTSLRDPVPRGPSRTGAGGRRQTLLGSPRRRPARRQAADSEPVAQPVTAARAPRRRLSPTTTWRPRPPQEAGGRGGRRRPGQLTASPPAAQHRLSHPREPEIGPGASSPPGSRGAGLRGPGPCAPLSPRGGP